VKLAIIQAKKLTKLLDCSLVEAHQNGAQASIRERPGLMPAVEDGRQTVLAVIDLTMYEVQLLIHYCHFIILNKNFYLTISRIVNPTLPM